MNIPAGVGGTNDLNVQFTSTPEPTTIMLLCAGLAGLGMNSRRRKNGVTSYIAIS
jgi:hypothetical protein